MDYILRSWVLPNLTQIFIICLKVESAERAIAEINGSLVSGVQLKVRFERKKNVNFWTDIVNIFLGLLNPMTNFCFIRIYIFTSVICPEP